MNGAAVHLTCPWLSPCTGHQRTCASAYPRATSCESYGSAAQSTAHRTAQPEAPLHATAARLTAQLCRSCIDPAASRVSAARVRWSTPSTRAPSSFPDSFIVWPGHDCRVVVNRSLLTRLTSHVAPLTHVQGCFSSTFSRRGSGQPEMRRFARSSRFSPTPAFPVYPSLPAFNSFPAFSLSVVSAFLAFTASSTICAFFFHRMSSQISSPTSAASICRLPNESTR